MMLSGKEKTVKKKMFVTFILGLGLTLALLVLLESSSVTAAPVAVITVTKVTDDNGTCQPSDCSLREAIIAANASPGDDTIALPAGTYVLTITGTGEDAAVTGDLDIFAQGAVTITGAGPDNTIIDAGSIDRVFHIHTGYPVAIAGVTVKGGAVAGDGGGIYHLGPHLSLVDVSIIENTAADGAGLYIRYASDVVLSSGQISSNTASFRGGGVFVSASNSVFTQTNGSTIAYNTADDGGGVGLLGGNAVLEGGTVVENSATNGGGVWVQNGGHLVVDGGDIVDNSATSGGGVYVTSASALLRSGTINENQAFVGAGVHNASGDFVLNGGLIGDNTATGSGGGVSSSGMFTMSGSSTIAGNRADHCGGVEIQWNHATLSGGQIITNSSSDYGGGVCAHNHGHVTLSGSQILSNSAQNAGGGVYVDDVGTAFYTQTAGLVAYNTVPGSGSNEGGGGIYIDFGHATITGGRVLGNVAYRGGGIYMLTFDAVLNVTGGQIVSNSAGLGGGVYKNGGLLTLVNSTLSGNQASGTGAALSIVAGTTFLSHTTVASNTGTAIYGIDYQGGPLSVANTLIAYNSGQNCNTTLGSNGYNIDSDGTCNLGATGDIVTDPLLAPLGEDEGTLVHAIDTDSPAYNAGQCTAGVTTDQRGFPRLPPCDIGAYEYVHGQAYLPLTLRNY
jgi:CSLREA domain-containing protein